MCLWVCTRQLVGVVYRSGVHVHGSGPVKSLCLCLWPTLLVNRVTVFLFESRRWWESLGRNAATNCASVSGLRSGGIRIQHSHLSLGGVFYVAGIKAACEACWGVISSGSAAACMMDSEESPMFNWRSLYRRTAGGGGEKTERERDVKKQRKKCSLGEFF